MITTYPRRIYTSFITNIVDVPSRLVALLCFLLLLLFPVTRPGQLLLTVLTYANIIAIFAASWDLLVGRVGQISLGHALFFGIGAYTTALLYHFYALPLWATIPLATLCGVSVAVLVGFPSMRVKGPYLALVSMAFPLILTGLIYYFRAWTGGENGISGLPQFLPIEFFTQMGLLSSEAVYPQKIAEYYITLLFLLVSGILLYKIANSKIGITFISILDDEQASKSCGINTTKYKLMAFAISACFASFAGAVYAHIVTAIGPGATLSVTLSFLPVIMTMFGGLGTIYGPIAATFIIQTLDQYILKRVVDVPLDWHPVIFTVILIIVIIKWPRGIAKFVTDKFEDLQEARELEERGKHIWKREKKKSSISKG